MRKRLITAVVSLFAIAGLTACANTDTEAPTTPDDGEIRSSGMTLGAQIPAESEVDQIRFRVTPVNCSTGAQMGSVMTQTKDLQDMMLPGGISKFEGAPFDADSEHIFADAFFLLDATGQGGPCYNVRTRPLNNGSPAQGCEPATRNRVAVEDGQTTEILLVNQCKGAARGGLDVISAINREPTIENLEFDKFLASCPTNTAQNEVCVQANDPDNDALEIEWSVAGGAQFAGDIIETVQERQLANGNWESCAQIAANRKGDYRFQVSVYDLDGNGTRMEQVLAEQGNPAQSRDSLTFPIYSGVDCQAKRATILMAIGDHGQRGEASIWRASDEQRARRLIREMARFVSPFDDKSATDVLYVLDDNNKGEHLPKDRQVVVNQLEQVFSGFDPMLGLPNTGDAIVEDPEGLTESDLEGYDFVWFANPGWPMDEVQTRNVLREANQRGVGVILEGDDMGRHAAAEDGLQYFTGLNFIRNGVTTCGDVTNNYSDNEYRVRLDDEPFSPLSNALKGTQIRYANDIDHTRRLLTGELPLSTWSYPAARCQPGQQRTGSAITAFNPPSAP